MARGASPLRYPGGKTSMLELIATTLRLNGLERGHYAEPYAGGCGLALSLLYGGFVSDIHINDIDPAVWSFWHCVLNETDALTALVEKTPVTVEEWRRQRATHSAMDLNDPLALGFSAFFLNRTNRSGVIGSGGVIGGLNQTGNYLIDCRFNREDLARRIVRVSRYAERIHLTRLDALDFLDKCKTTLPANSLLFIDPPYFKKGPELYTNFYKPDDHAKLAAKVLKIELPWVVTYDDVPDIRRLYRARRQYAFGINYSLNEKRVGAELLVVSKGLRVPGETRGGQVNRPQYRATALHLGLPA
ncbi:DNA adenine methylase [Phenylobacterium sp.]|uniref:DNA adenine methylase n=1 Tax=Phenylobacterium sp. TaxID=1871053 RepID=UPI0025E09091|nr:DNA adenine methylase [Phenylobacterium sp.]MCA3715651.1 DNA adenine methylase [Phenylobacterium sp.]